LSEGLEGESWAYYISPPNMSPMLGAISSKQYSRIVLCINGGRLFQPAWFFGRLVAEGHRLWCHP